MYPKSTGERAIQSFGFCHDEIGSKCISLQEAWCTMLFYVCVGFLIHVIKQFHRCAFTTRYGSICYFSLSLTFIVLLFGQLLRAMNLFIFHSASIPYPNGILVYSRRYIFMRKIDFFNRTRREWADYCSNSIGVFAPLNYTALDFSSFKSRKIQ